MAPPGSTASSVVRFPALPMGSEEARTVRRPDEVVNDSVARGAGRALRKGVAAMPRYRANLHYVDDHGQEHSKTVEVNTETDKVEEIARAMQEEWVGFQQSGEERLPEHIDWERVE